MHIVVVGLNYRTAPVEIREKFAIIEGQLPEALKRLKETKGILESVIVATCNRTEIYAVVDRLQICGHYICGFLEEWFGIPRKEFVKCLYIYEDKRAVKHLLRVVSGLDSMVIGETQILGQVRTAFFTSQELGMTGTIFNHLFQQAITFAKRAHTETAINENAVSISYAAVELGKKIFGTFEGKTVMIVGAGKMGELTAKHLVAGGADKIIVANRTEERAAQLAKIFHAETCLLSELTAKIPEIDVLITSTGAQEWLLTREQLAQLPRQAKRPLFMIDISVPRNLDPEIKHVPNVFLYDIDDLEGIVEENMEHRRKEAEKIESMIEEEVSAHEYWFKTLSAGPIIRALQEKSSKIHQNTLESLFNKLPELDERQRKVIQKLTRSIVTQIIQAPIASVKEMAAEENGGEWLSAFAKIFAIEDEIPHGNAKQRLDNLAASQDKKAKEHEEDNSTYKVKELVAGS